MKSAAFNLSDLTSTFLVLDNFKTAEDSNSIHGGAPNWLFLYYIREPADAALLHRVTAGNKKGQQQEDKLKTYCKVVSYFFDTYSTHDIVSKTKDEIVNFK